MKEAFKMYENKSPEGSPSCSSGGSEDNQSSPCCGPPEAGDPDNYNYSDVREYHFWEGFNETDVGPVPRVKTDLDHRDIMGAIRVRIGIKRGNYRVPPGLYSVGKPDSESFVFVTANYKLSFDALRKELTGLSAWILVLDTLGINVWCAAGKGTFSTEEVVKRVKGTGLDKVVHHKKLILPQLSAIAVSAHSVKKASGFEVIWGPVRAEDLRKFIEAGMKADQSMRMVTFNLIERFVLVPVEISQVPKPLFWILILLFIISGIGPDIFSLTDAWHRGLMAAAGICAGIIGGGVITPIALPWIPGRAFSIKGALIGLILGLGTGWIFFKTGTFFEEVAILFFAVIVSSFLAMNFTGATPFTSASGVEKEMRRAIPFQAGGVFVALVLWVGSTFTG